MEEQYFQEYENLEVHEIMLKDKSRLDSYYKAIMDNSALLKNKIVLDVGAGTGILSVFCAKAGCKFVYAVEASSLANIAVDTVEENNLSQYIKVIQSKIEDFELPAEIKHVDVIVSEWMGFYLLHEGMLDSIIFARDKFLKKNGVMFPQCAAIYVAPCTLPSCFDYWENVNGVQMTRFGTKLREQKSNKPNILTINPDNMLHEGIIVHWIDLEQVNSNELNEITCQEVVAIQKSGKHQGFCIWFECQFPSPNNEEPVILSTSPKTSATHWQQCVIALPDNSCEMVEEQEPIAFKLSMKRHSTSIRRYNLEIEILDPEQAEHPLPCYCYMTKCILSRTHLANLGMDEDS